MSVPTSLTTNLKISGSNDSQDSLLQQGGEDFVETSEKFLSNENFDMNRFSHNEEARLDAGAQVFRETIKIGPAVAPKLSEDLTPTSRTRRFKSFEAQHSPGRAGLMKKISEDPMDYNDKDQGNWHVSSGSDDDEPGGVKSKSPKRASQANQKMRSYFSPRQKTNKDHQYNNPAMVRDDETGGMGSSVGDSFKELPDYKRTRAASFTPGMSKEVRKPSMNHPKHPVEKPPIPDNLFIEMDVLKPGGWQEQARWLKFEETLLEGADRWGNPHVSSLTFHSLINLRLVLEKGVFVLDLEVKDFHSFVYHIVGEISDNDKLSEQVRVDVFRSLLLSHRYVDMPTGNFNLNGLRRRLSRSSTQTSFGSRPEALSHHKKRNSSFNLSDKERHKSQLVLGDAEGGFPNPPSFSDLQKIASANRPDSIMNKIEEGTEGTMALVGALKSLDKPIVAFARLSPAVIMPNVMEVPLPIRFIFILLTPENSPSMDYHEVGRSFCTLMSNKNFQTIAYKMDDRQELLNSINHFLDDTVVLPPGDWDERNLLSISEIKELKRKKRLRMETLEKLKKEKNKDKKKSVDKKATDDEPKDNDPLARTRVPFGGIIKEIKERYPKYLSDITDSFSILCVASILFIFFVVLASAIAFGGLWAQKTDRLIGIPETLIVSSAIGCGFALFSCQPLAIVGVTGPLMVFDEALFKFSKNAEVEFLTWRVWISFWSIIISLVVAAFQGSFVVKYFTTFTKDIFASFIASIYIAEAIHNTIEMFEHHPPLHPEAYCHGHNGSDFEHAMALTDHGNSSILDHFGNETVPHGFQPEVHHNEPNTAFKTFILQYCTFAIALFLKKFRNKKALGRTIRRALGDFGVPIAILIMVGVDQAFPAVYTDKLIVPEGLEVTAPEKREWFISPLGIKEMVPIWIPFVSVLPAILVYLLLFMETSICELILMDKAKKGSGLHWDIVLLCLLNSIAGLLGGPWICVATVRAMSHLSALTVMSTTHAPGESAKVIEIKDQRVTAFFVYLLVGLSVLLNPVLKLVPTSVIFGIFLYMGTYSLHGMEFYERLCLVLMPVKYHPNVSYCRKVRTWKMHLYTASQALGLSILWIVKSTSAALAFPFFVVGMVPLRLVLRFFFTPKELDALDGPNSAKGCKAEDDEPDFLDHGIAG